MMQMVQKLSVLHTALVCLLVVAMGLAALSGCGKRGSGKAASPGVPQPLTTFERNESYWADEETVLEVPLLVRYTRRGGFTGRDEVLVVHDDGLLEFALRDVEERVHRVDAARLHRLRRIVLGPGFAALTDHAPPARSPYAREGPDLVRYIIEVEAQDHHKAILATDGTVWPPALRQAIRELDALRRSAITRGERVEAESQ